MYFRVFAKTDIPWGTGLCSDVLPLYETVIGTSAIDSPLFDIFISISVDTDMPSSVG